MDFNREATSSSSALDSPLLPSTASDADGLHHRLSSQPKVFANVFIAIVGAGVLGLPYTFMRTGWLAGVLMLLAVAALVCHCMMLLVRIRRRLDIHPYPSPGSSMIASFGDLGFAVSGPSGRLAVDVMIVLSQAGFCVGYTIFIANTLAHLFPISISFLPFLSTKSLFVWAMLPFQMGLNSIKSLTLLAPLSIFADVVDLGAMGVVLGQDIVIYLEHRPPIHPFTDPSVLLYGLGVAVYTFEGIGMVLPLEVEAAEKRKFGHTLGMSMAFIAAIYAVFGALGYAAFGDETRDIITTNFGGGIVTLLVQLGLCINLIFTFPVMMNPVYEIGERRISGKRYCWWMRWVAVVGVSMAATLVPNFTDFLSLVGSSVCVVLGFVLPAMFHLKVFGADLGWVGVAADAVIIMVGLVVAVSGTWSSLTEIF